ncbi:hypothetical protein RRG08_063733 [Elysia crispata]|uniref:Uncharacterized protein n=1 Tax=Elysia crispata TaxID=231223 RepID=A0AAE1DNB9_9GAST|nr:hypothetical protein RRG08_063733 [Elysia crispata]
MGLMHHEAKEKEHCGTNIVYTATISGQKDIHLMIVRLPQLYKYDLEIPSITLGMSDHLVVLIKVDKIYVRTVAAMNAIPMRPSILTSLTRPRNCGRWPRRRAHPEQSVDLMKSLGSLPDDLPNTLNTGANLGAVKCVVLRTGN